MKWIVSAAVLSVGAAAGTTYEINWLPCGVLQVGDRGSEARAGYESAGEIVLTELQYRDGAGANPTGRLVRGAETFRIMPTSVRSGPAPADVVIVRRVDSRVGLQLQVTVGSTEVGTWRIEPLAGEARWRDALFVIPEATWRAAAPYGHAVPVTIQSSGEHVSVEYRLYSTRDWAVLRARGTAAHAEEYLAGLRAEGDHDWEGARAAYARVARAADADVARLARAALRRVKARAAQAAMRREPPRDAFAAQYALGLYAGAIGCWDAALEAFRAAVAAQPTHADATYRLAEAMQYNRYPAEDYAPLAERAGLLAGREPNVARVLMAVHADAVPGMCGTLSERSLAQLQRDWRIVEQLVYGASRGGYKLETTWRIRRAGDPPWVMQTGWIFLPPDETVPVEGTFDYSIGSAEYGSSHAGGVDCGVSRSGGAQIGATRGWEVLLHEWNHQFDWVCVFGGQVPGYPTTHDSDGCGKQPIVNMGCGHQASMRYYVNPAQYRRHRPSHPRVVEAAITAWRVGGWVEGPHAPHDAAALEAWLVEHGYAKPAEIAGRRREWEAARARLAAEATNPPVIASQGAPPVPATWEEALRGLWYETAWLQKLHADDETAIITGRNPLEREVHTAAAGEERGMVEFTNLFGNAAEKSVVYARTLVLVPHARTGRLWLGYNGRAQAWLNGRRIHHGTYRSCAKWENKNQTYMFAAEAALRAGTNVLVMKIERCAPGWGLNVHLVDDENRAMGDVTYLAEAIACDVQVALPEAGPYYLWQDVADDWMERLPRLTDEDLGRITGIAGLRCAATRFHLTLPPGVAPQAGSRYTLEQSADDVQLNNYLNWDREAVAALRFERAGQVRDLLLIRPEYIEEYLRLARRSAGMDPAAQVLGYVMITDSAYSTTPNRTPRAALVVETQLGEYPLDELDVLRLEEGT